MYSPQDGQSLSGSSVTLRGFLDDPTAQVSVELVDATGTTNTQVGVVERNGQFWVEDLPLSPGSNTVALTATDAAGNAASTNFVVIGSTVSLQVNALPEDQLYKPTLEVSGSIDTTGYTVWVNGVTASLNSDGTWTAHAVPIPDGGTAVVQARAIPNSDHGGAGVGGGGVVTTANSANPASAGSLQSEIQPDKPMRLYVESDTQTHSFHYHGHSETWDTTAGLVSLMDLVEDYPYTQIWNDGSGGGGNWSMDIDNTGLPHAHCDVHFSWPPTRWPDLVEGSQTVSGGFAGEGAFNTGPVAYPPCISQDHCDVKDPSDYSEAGWVDYGSLWQTTTIHQDYSRNSQTTMKLFTGGKKVAGRKNLFVVTCPASDVLFKQGDCYVPAEGLEPVSPERVTVGELGKLGSDGRLYVALPDGVTKDVTAKVSGSKFYKFNPGATKHKLRIAANGIPLAEDRVVPSADFCVGQKVSFTYYFTPEVPAVSTIHAQWIFGGRYVNDVWYNYDNYAEPMGSANYYLNSDKLNLPIIDAWWTSGGFNPPATYSATVSAILEFQNGQSARVHQTGQFHMYRPNVRDFSPITPWVPQIADSPYLSISLGRGQGVEAAAWKVFIDRAQQFTGDAFHTQLINRLAHVRHSSFTETITTGDEFWLDSQEHYINGETPLFGSSCNLNYSDQPSAELITQFTDITDNFKSYIRFLPDSAGSIPVTLALVTWSWSARADQTNGVWSVTNSAVGGPTFADSEAFPFWVYVYPTDL